jgi:uncharacterized protein DUF4339
MREEWFYSGPEGRVGPMTLQDLQTTIASHPNGENLFVWRDGFVDWVRVRDIRDVLASIGPGPAPEELAASFDEVNSHISSLRHVPDPPVRDAPRFSSDARPYDDHDEGWADLSEPRPKRRGRRKRRSATGVLFGLLVGAVGGGLIYLGLSGAVPWSEEVFGFRNELLDALPGAIMCLFGLSMIFRKR